MRNKRGFTLMEMLIVVAIISILISIAIPSFSGQLEKAREARDLANIRNVYARLVETVELDFDPEPYMKKNGSKANGYYYTVYVPVTQKKPGWQTKSDAIYVQFGDDGYVTCITKSKKVSKYYKLNYYWKPELIVKTTLLDSWKSISGLPADAIIRFSGEMNSDDASKTTNQKTGQSFVYP